jgi:hypothetical protein
MKPVPRTIEERVIESLSAAMCQVMTAQELLNDMNHYYPKVKLASLSSKLKKMVDSFVLLRVNGYGPRGGFGYLMNPNYKELDLPPKAERIRQDNASGPGN